MYVNMLNNSSARYYQKKRKVTKKGLRKIIYQNLPEEEKEKKWHYGCERYENLPEHEKKVC